MDGRPYCGYVIEVELPCINGLSAWFQFACVYERDDQERLMSNGRIASAKVDANALAEMLNSSGGVQYQRDELFDLLRRVREFGGLEPQLDQEIDAALEAAPQARREAAYQATAHASDAARRNTSLSEPKDDSHER